MKNLKVLSLEDDANLAIVMEHYFKEEGHALIQVETGQQCLEAVQNDTFDILLMDLGLPDMDGLSLIPQLKTHFDGPIIVVSGKTSTTDRVVGLEMGADDYIVKPFELRELMARIKANVRRQPDPSQQNSESESDTPYFIYKFLGFEFNDAKFSLHHEDIGTIEITSGESELLQIFLRSNGRALTREYLHENTRDGSYESFDRAVDIAVTRLRKKLNDDPTDPKIIKTIRGVGYMFVADIEKSPTQ